MISFFMLAGGPPMSINSWPCRSSGRYSMLYHIPFSQKKQLKFPLPDLSLLVSRCSLLQRLNFGPDHAQVESRRRQAGERLSTQEGQPHQVGIQDQEQGCDRQQQDNLAQKGDQQGQSRPAQGLTLDRVLMIVAAPTGKASAVMARGGRPMAMAPAPARKQYSSSGEAVTAKRAAPPAPTPAAKARLNRTAPVIRLGKWAP